MPDARGLLTPSEVEQLRQTRAAEQWERTDTICIGPGANAIDNGWFNTWAAFSAADELVWFSGRSSNVGRSYCNQLVERTDWAQDIYQTLVELIPPVGIQDIESDANDALISPLLFMQELANQLNLVVRLAESDDIASAPASHYPAGFGTAFPAISAAAAPVVVPGANGQPQIRNGWKWPEPIKLAAKSKLTVIGRVDNPLRGLLAAMPGPGVKHVPVTGGEFDYSNFYRIRITMRGPRYLQLRGARSSA